MKKKVSKPAVKPVNEECLLFTRNNDRETPVYLTESIAKKVLSTVDAGLSDGLGIRRRGMMCVEAAVCYALGLDHMDDPPCVGSAVGRLKISINDVTGVWKSKKDRAQALRKLAIAQLGSNGFNQIEFRKLVIQQATRKLIVPAFRKMGRKVNPEWTSEMLLRWKSITDYLATHSRRQNAQRIEGYQNTFGITGLYQALNYNNPTHLVQMRFPDDGDHRKWVLKLIDITLGALKTMKSPGCKYLYLCE